MRTVPLAIFAVFWTSLVVLFDHGVGKDLSRQFESRHYASVEGEITYSELTTTRGYKGGRHYHAVINYRYELGPRRFYGHRLRYLNSPGDYGTAESFVDAHPVGSSITVYYKPDDPGDALLFPGIEGQDCLLFFLTAPFCAIALGLCTWAAGEMRRIIVRPEAGGVKIVREGSRIRARLPMDSALGVALIVFGGLGFVLLFVIGFSTGMRPGLGLVATGIGITYLSGPVAYFLARSKIESGVYDLVIDQDARTIELPPEFGRKQREKFPLADVTGLRVDMRMHTSGKGGVSHTYAPLLEMGKTNQSLQLADWGDQKKAEEFSAWLRQKIGA